MAAKAVIQIPVDSAQFEKFFDLYKSYRGKLDEEPAAWEALNDAMGGAGEALEKGAVSGREALALAAAQAELIVDHLRAAGKIQNDFSRATSAHSKEFVNLGRAGSGAWRAIGGAADASIAKTSSGLMDMVKSIAPLAGEAVAALLGPIGVGIAAFAGGITGLKALADAGVGRQRTAFGLGTTTGKAASFETYASQFLGQDALQSAVNAQSNYGSAGALASLGIDFNKARKMAPGDLAFAILKSGVRIANASPNVPLGNNPLLAQYAALTGDTNFDQLRNAIAMGGPALDAAQRKVNANAMSMGLDRNAVQKGLGLTQALAGAGVRGQTWAINNLSGADPFLTKLIDTFTGAPGSGGGAATGLHLVDVAGRKAAAALDKVTSALHLPGGPGRQGNSRTSYGSAGDPRNAPGWVQAFGDWWNYGVTGRATSGAAGGPFSPQDSWNQSARNAIGGPADMHNPLNMKVLRNGSAVWANYSSIDEGIRGNAARLAEFAKVWGIPNTMASIIRKWDPEGIGLSGEYAAHVEKWSGVSKYLPLDKMTPEQFAKVFSAMSRQEGNEPVNVQQVMKALFSQQQRNQRTPMVNVKVTNSTQSRVSVSVNAAALSNQR